MKLMKFSIENYKVFNNPFIIDFNNEENNFTILTGRNNTGKSTLLEAIDEFYKKADSKNIISDKCFNDVNREIKMSSDFLLDKNNCVWEDIKESCKDLNQIILRVEKIYSINTKAKFEVMQICDDGNISTLKKATADIVIKYLSEISPFYIKPTMTVEEINANIKSLYIAAIESQLNADSKALNGINQQIEQIINEKKSGVDTEINQMQKEISENLYNLFPEQELTLKLTGGSILEYSLKDIVKNFQLEISVSNSIAGEMALDNQGTGVQRMSLIFTIKQMIQQYDETLGKRLLLIDEPEAFLHPEAIRMLSNVLYEIGGTIPTIITTHSPILINLEKNHKHVDVLKIDKKNHNAITLYSPKNIQFDSNDETNMKILNYVDSYINEFFFSEKNIIVEGTTEKMFLKKIREKYNLNFHIIEARGKATIVTLMKILNQFNTEYYVLHDLDNFLETEKSLKTQRTNCIKIFEEKGHYSKIFATQNSFEPTFYSEEIKSSEKTLKALEIISDDSSSIRNDIFQTFNKIFELGIKDLPDQQNNNVININSEDDINQQFNLKD